jgi:hypothetical protein
MWRIILGDFNGKETQMFWEFVFVIKRGGRYRNHWDLKEFTNIYITQDLILLGLGSYLFSVLVKFFRPYRSCNRTLFG